MPAALGPGEVAVLLDGGKSGNASRLLAPWKEETRAAGAGKRKESTTQDDDDDEEEQDEEEDEKGEDEQKPGFAPVPPQPCLHGGERGKEAQTHAGHGIHQAVGAVPHCGEYEDQPARTPPQTFRRKQLWRHHCWADDAGP